MPKHQHELTPVGSHNNGWGKFEKYETYWFSCDRIHAARDNKNFAYFARSYDAINAIFKGEVCAKFRDEMVCHSLSFDGLKFAIAVPNCNGGFCDVWWPGRDATTQHLHTGYTIFINGKPIYEVNCGIFHEIVWIDNDHLVWAVGNLENGRYKDTEYFDNGKKIAGKFGIQHFHGGFMLIRIGDEAYRINGDGSRQGHFAIDNSERALWWRLKGLLFKRFDLSKHIKEKDGSLYLSYGGKETRLELDKITYVGVLDHEYALGQDSKKLAFVGERYHGKMGALVRKADDYLDKTPEGKKSIWKSLAQFVAWPQLPGDADDESFFRTWSRKFHIVQDGKVWDKGYDYIAHFFFAPNNELVVTAYNGKFCIVINEEEGPWFDAVVNVHYLKEEGGICYLARDGNEFFRVVVK